MVCSGSNKRTLRRPKREIEALYTGICVKNGDPDHDKAHDIFMFEETLVSGTYWFDKEPTYKSEMMMIPQGTIITQAKDQPADADDFRITVEMPWGAVVDSLADL